MYKFCILAAGIGSRVTFYDDLHKALLPIENRPAISLILDTVPKDVEVVVAVGHLSSQIISYLNYVHPDRKFTFVKIDDYNSKDGGPGKSLYQCKEFLQCPFIFTSVDTILPSITSHTAPRFNWIGVNAASPVDYHVLLYGVLVRKVVPPIFIGIAGVNDYEKFFNDLEGKKEVTDALNNFEPLPFNWIDTGSDATYSLINSSKIVPSKPNEILFMDNGKVVKFFTDVDKTSRLFSRSHLFLPETELLNSRMIARPFIDGVTLTNLPYSLDTLNQLQSLVEDCTSLEFIHHDCDLELFLQACNHMYFEKTHSRIQDFLKKYPEIDSIQTVNGMPVKPISFYLDNLPWEVIANSGLPIRNFHGDIQPENIIFNPKDGSFKFIDHRDSFGGLPYGDLYYDLAKLWHGCIVSNREVLRENYSVSIDLECSSAEVSINTIPHLLKILELLEKDVKKNSLDWRKVEVLGALQYISIACLYEEKYSSFLFLLGKLSLELLSLNGTQSIIKSLQKGI